ncbi:DUF6232 family protein [Nonomuraea sp. NPDC050328]|uniref:DUF6232 family protein n=1 Tax=Nonomuraea sp. NPDC050328 TaxID=3364361 RepID=UPI0037A1D9F6
MPRNSTIEVKVHRRVLWVGGEAYPVQNIARAYTMALRPRRGLALAQFLRAVVLWTLLAAAAMVGSDYVDLDVDRRLIVAALCVVVLISAVQYLVRVLQRTYYALVIETAGTPRTALVSSDHGEVARIVHEVMKAIGDPNASFSQTITTNNHYGDKITQLGSQNIGKVAR